MNEVDLSKHVGHTMRVNQFGNKLTLSCSCYEDIMEQKVDTVFKVETKVDTGPTCSRDDEGCISCSG